MHDKAEDVVPQVAYEWWMLCETYRLHGRFSRDCGTEIERKASLECFLLHARNLYHFLTRCRSSLKHFEKTDVVAEDFFDDLQDWEPATNLTFLEDNKTRLNRSLSHISYDRIDYERSKKWVAMDVVFIELNRAWTSFLDSLTEATRNRFLEALQRLQSSNSH